MAGSIGPTGHLPASDDPTLGNDLVPRARRGLRRAGPGPDPRRRRPLIIETAQDILEVKAAIFGVREAFKTTGRELPIQASVSLLPNGGKMLLGTDISAVLTTLEALKVDVIGLNCSTGPEDMRDAIRFLGEYSPVPVHCIPNAGIPHQGPNGETIFPEGPEQLPTSWASSSTATACHRRRLLRHDARPHPRDRRALRAHTPSARPAPRAPHVSSMIRHAARAGAPARRWSASASTPRARARPRRCCWPTTTTASTTVAEDQVEGGAHVLDLCVALTERQDEDEQMRLVAKKVSLTQPAPIQIDSTEPNVIETALDQIPGRAIVNSVNLEAGRDKLDRVVPIAQGPRRRADRADNRRGRHGQDRASASSRSPSASTSWCCDEHGIPPPRT